MEITDLNELELDIQEAFLEIGDTENIAFLKFEGGEENIYRESKKKRYGQPIVVTGRVKINPVSEEISDIGRTGEVNALFTFTTKDLRDNDLLDETLKITVDDRITFREDVYSILNIVPTSMLGDRFLIYKFECKKV